MFSGERSKLVEEIVYGRKNRCCARMSMYAHREETESAGTGVGEVSKGCHQGENAVFTHLPLIPALFCLPDFHSESE